MRRVGDWKLTNKHANYQTVTKLKTQTSWFFLHLECGTCAHYIFFDCGYIYLWISDRYWD